MAKDLGNVPKLGLKPKIELLLIVQQMLRLLIICYMEKFIPFGKEIYPFPLKAST